jgi:hypothetical protein
LVLWEKAAFLFRKIHHDRAGFENADRRAAALGIVVDQHRHPMVGVDLQEFRLELIAAANIARHQIVIETELLEQNCNFLAVWRRPKMKIEHRHVPRRCWGEPASGR